MSVSPWPAASRSRPAGVSDMTLDLDVDPVTAVKIREIHQMKEEAVAREDYDEAKRLRDGINRLKVGSRPFRTLIHPTPGPNPP